MKAASGRKSLRLPNLNLGQSGTQGSGQSTRVSRPFAREYNWRMRDVIVLQSIWAIVPAVLIVGLCLALNCVLSKQRQIPLRFDLTTLIILITTLCVLWQVTAFVIQFRGKFGDNNRPGMASLGFWVFPFVWFVRQLIETWRQNLQRRVAQKSIELPKQVSIQTMKAD